MIAAAPAERHEQPGHLRIRRRPGLPFSIVQMLQRPPSELTLYRPEPARAETFVSLERLARRIHKLRGRRPIAIRRAPRAEGASVTFAAFDIFALDGADGEEWIGAAAIQSRSATALEAALRDVQPEDA